MAFAEIDEHQNSDKDHDNGSDYKGVGGIGKGKIDIHAIDAGDEGERQHDDGDDGEDAHDFVDAIACQSVGSFGEAVDDFVVLVDDIAQFEEVVDDIAEVFFHVFLQDGMVDRFELLDDGDLVADDAAQGDDIAAQQGDLLDGVFGVRFE